MIERFTRFPAALASQARSVYLGEGKIPALLAHPDWATPAPTVIWLHGRTVNKELDPGRYLRWIRAGIAACAIDLPGHGERLDQSLQGSASTLDLLERTIPEIDQVVPALADAAWKGVFDSARFGIGGMSAGGMATLRRLCDRHPFRCAAVEATTGDIGGLMASRSTDAASEQATSVARDGGRIERLDPMHHLSGWRPIPLLVLHSEADQVVPFAGMRRFVDALRGQYAAKGADPGMIELMTWAQTGAPYEHVGFGNFANDAKNAQTDFFRRLLGAP